jgi:hypothetical protein
MNKKTRIGQLYLPKVVQHLVMLFAMLLVNFVHGQTPTLTIISHPKGCPTEMKESELKSIFLGEKQRWRTGDKIQVALMKTNTSIGKSICGRMYNMTEDELKKYWLALVFQGKAEAPAFFNTVSELQSFVSENPGAIGIIDQTPPASGIQVVSIDGKKTL